MEQYPYISEYVGRLTDHTDGSLVCQIEPGKFGERNDDVSYMGSTDKIYKLLERIGDKCKICDVLPKEDYRESPITWHPLTLNDWINITKYKEKMGEEQVRNLLILLQKYREKCRDLPRMNAHHIIDTLPHFTFTPEWRPPNELVSMNMMRDRITDSWFNFAMNLNNL